MKWVKQGNIFARRHAQVPTVDVLGKTWRVYYASRDSKNRSYTTFVDLDAENPRLILNDFKKPILDLGTPGSFDDCGIMPSHVINIGSIKRMYYVGWTKRQTVPYHNGIGVAESYDNGLTYHKLFDGPILTTTAEEPYFCGTSWVIFDEEDVTFKMYYMSTTEWRDVDGKMEPRYHIKYAESMDGIKWNRTGHVAVDYADDNEGGIVKATILHKKHYHMWFSHRNINDYRYNKNNTYKIGYATSETGFYWERADELAGISLGEDSWDDEMICYPHVFEHGGKIHMLYNGNGFGATGFGWAILEDF